MIDNFPKVEDQVKKIVRHLIQEKQYVEFLVGRDGDFDQIVASTVRRVKRAVRDDNSVLVWVMPCLNSILTIKKSCLITATLYAESNPKLIN